MAMDWATTKWSRTARFAAVGLLSVSVLAACGGGDNSSDATATTAQWRNHRGHGADGDDGSRDDGSGWWSGRDASHRGHASHRRHVGHHGGDANQRRRRCRDADHH